MAASVAQAFEVFKSGLEITGLQESVVSSRQESVREVVKRKFQVLDDFLTGSYRRHTMIAPLAEADVDIFVVLGVKHYNEVANLSSPQAGLLDHLRSALRETYTRTPDISRNGQAVTIRFTDFLVDVVPAFNRQGGGFLIPSSTAQRWIPTDPNVHVRVISEANTRHAGRLVPLVKMIKAWNRETGSFFHSFHLELLAQQILDNVTISDFPSGLRYFFNSARMKVQDATPDPAGFNNDVGAYVKTSFVKLDEAATRFEKALEAALHAEEDARSQRIAQAIARWQNLMGRPFPSFG